MKHQSLNPNEKSISGKSAIYARKFAGCPF